MRNSRHLNRSTASGRMRGFARVAVTSAALVSLVLVSACESLKPDPVKEEKRETIFGEGGLFFGGSETKRDKDSGGALGVNSFLWRASLDTITFMPVTSADPFGGVIITDWYTPPETPDERFKMNIYILGRALRADGVRVSVFKEIRDPRGAWVSGPTAADVGTNIENAILLRARQLRHETTNQ
ncbi:MAG: DUF3576 domain-containing protein [Rhodospirillales bacterium]|nr:DUF3576 domain-containing protein [Rhodospirillales bacterium]